MTSHTNGAHNAQPELDSDELARVMAEVSVQDATASSDARSSYYRTLHPATAAVHADDPLNTRLSDVAPPIHVSTTFRYSSDPAALVPAVDRAAVPGAVYPFTNTAGGEHIYSRITTHGASRLETILSPLIGGHPCLVYGSGLAALYAILVHVGPKQVVIGDGYHGCHGTLRLYCRTSGAVKLPLDFNPDELQQGDLICLETPLNPTGTAFDIAHFAEIAHARGAYLLVDSTFAPPPLQDPFKHGADLVMHSGTKYFGGHSDMLCGVVGVHRKYAADWVPKMVADREYLGSPMGGLESWLGIRSVRTLELRVTRQSTSAQRLVDAFDGALTGQTVGTGLSQSDAETIKKVLREVQHASLQRQDWKKGWLKKQMPNGFGPVFAIVTRNKEIARHLPSKLRLFHHATSLGGVESLIEWRTMTDRTVSPELMRVSVGVEDDRDLLDDFLQAFRTLIEELKL